MSLTFAKTSFQVQRGLTWSEEITILQSAGGEPVDLTGKELLMQVRRKLGDEVPVLELSSTNGELTVSEPLEGKVRLLVSADRTLDLPLANFKRAKYLYDWILITPGAPEVREPGTSGSITVRHTVTRPWA